MAAKKPFSIADYVQPDDVSNLDHPAESAKVIEIPIDDICCNDKNFYDTSNIDELVKSIALNGLLEPVIVKPDVCSPQFRNGKQFYRLISGHRRFLSFKRLNEEEPEKWATIPAIVREPKNEIVEELMLIEANRATRVLSSADTLKQAERYKALLVELKEQGVEIPGRLRDVVAEAMNISASRLARLEVIKKGLCPELMTDFEAGRLNESSAYATAQRLPQSKQLMFKRMLQDNNSDMTEWKAKGAADICEKCEKLKCKHDGKPCGHVDERLKLYAKQSHISCSYTSQCCESCSSLSTCVASCVRAEAKKKALRADKKAKNKEEKDLIQAEKDKSLHLADVMWMREAWSRKKASVEASEIANILKADYFMYMDAEKLATCEAENQVEDRNYRLMAKLPAYMLRELAKTLGCSTDYLLGLTDDMHGSACAPTTVWRPASERPPENARVIAKAGRDGHIRALRYKNAKYVFDADETVEYGFEVEMWIPYPEEPRDE
jgi:ParB family chromosome partitioning protein